MIIPGATKMLRVGMAQIPTSLVNSIIFTLNKSQSETTPTLQKRYESDGSGAVKYIDGDYCIPMTQEETLLFDGVNFMFVEAQVNFISGPAVMKIPGPRQGVGSTQATELIEGNAPDLDQDDYFEMTIADAIFLDGSMETIEKNVSLSQTAADEAKTARDVSVSAKDTSVQKADEAATSANNASTSEANAVAARTAIENMTVSANTLAEGSNATADKTFNEDGSMKLVIGIPKGDTGAQGEQGIQGLQGAKGDTGEQGVQGLKGDTGEQGIQGIQGEAGPNEVTATTTTDISGLLKGNGSNVLQAVPGEDYQAPLPSVTNNEGKFLGLQNSALAWINYVIAGATGGVTISSGASDNVALTLQEAEGQAGAVFKINDYSNNNRFYINSTGNVFTNGILCNMYSEKASVSLASTGTLVKRDVADANAALTVNQANVASTGKILDLQFGGVTKTYIDTNGVVRSAGICSSSSITFGNLVLGSSISPVQLSRTVESNVTAFVVNQANINSTGNILDLMFNSSIKASVDKDGCLTGGNIDIASTDVSKVGLTVHGAEGQNANFFEIYDFANNLLFAVQSNDFVFIGNKLYTAYGLANNYTSSNAYVNTAPTGTIISRNVADANPALIVNQSNAASTGNPLQIRSNNELKAYFDLSGNIHSLGFTLRIANSSTPSSSVDTGSKGQIKWDSNYIYVCTSDNTWKRAALTTW